VAYPAAADERPHPPGDHPGWGESWSFEFFTAAGLGGYVTLTLFPSRGAAWYWAYLVGDGGGGPVAVIDDDAPLPRPPGSLELRTEGLWADHICETPLDHWTIGNEAFALRFDDPDEVFGRQRGERVPLGFDLEWETAAASARIDDGYAVPCVVHGEVLVGHDRLAINGSGWRDHRWGHRLGRSAGRRPARRRRLARRPGRAGGGLGRAGPGPRRGGTFAGPDQDGRRAPGSGVADEPGRMKRLHTNQAIAAAMAASTTYWNQSKIGSTLSHCSRRR
jgi:hypothetical protein